MREEKPLSAPNELERAFLGLDADGRPKPGVYEDVPADLYHSLPLVSSSALRTVLTGSYRKARQERFSDLAPTPAMVLGSAIHLAVLEPGYLRSRTVVIKDLRSKANKEAAAQARAAGKLVLTPEQLQIAEQVGQSCWSDPDCPEWGQLMSRAKYKEVTLIWDEGPVRCKARLDCMDPAWGLIVDVKTSGAISPRDMQRKLFNHGLDIQAAFYTDGAINLGINVRSYVIAAIATDGTGELACYELSDETLQAGRDRYKPILHGWAECEKTGRWPSRVRGIRLLSHERWALNRIYEGEE